MNNLQQITNCKIGNGVKIYDFVNLYGCIIGENCRIGTFVEIQKNVVIGNNVKIQSHTFICEGVVVEDNVFIGHHVVFINDNYPRSTTSSGKLQDESDWKVMQTKIKKGVSIGSSATILGGITIGKNAIVGAGSIVTKNVAANTIVAGNPAKFIRKIT